MIYTGIMAPGYKLALYILVRILLSDLVGCSDACKCHGSYTPGLLNKLYLLTTPFMTEWTAAWFSRLIMISPKVDKDKVS